MQPCYFRLSSIGKRVSFFILFRFCQIFFHGSFLHARFLGVRVTPMVSGGQEGTENKVDRRRAEPSRGFGLRALDSVWIPFAFVRGGPGEKFLARYTSVCSRRNVDSAYHTRGDSLYAFVAHAHTHTHTQRTFSQPPPACICACSSVIYVISDVQFHVFIVYTPCR